MSESEPEKQSEVDRPLGSELAKRVLEKAPAIIYVFDVARERVVFQNRNPGALLGYPDALAERVEGEWRTLVHPDDVRALPEYRRRLKAIKAGEILSWEFRVRHANGSWHWFATHDVLLEASGDGTPKLTVGSASDVTQQRQAQEHQELLLAEMQHRTRNLTTVIDAIARQSLPRNQPAVEEYYRVIIARLRALFSAAEVVMASEARMADLRKILEATLAAFDDEGTKARIALEGPPLAMPEEAAASLALAVHELATNATKYGALSSREGIVNLTWDLNRSNGTPKLEILWKENGGPPVKQPSHEGFGSRVIRYAASRQKDGKVDLTYASDGVSCRIAFALAR